MFGLEILTPWVFAASCLIAAFAGVVKGAVGFALPMLLISGLGSFLPAEVAVAALIGPTLVTNVFQGFRQGGRAAWEGLKAHRRYLLIAAAALLVSAQLVPLLDGRVILALIGLPITLFAAAQLAGWVLHVAPNARARVEVLFGIVSGFFGGLAGVWGPPMVVYLTALGTPKQEQVRVQGVAFLMGGLLLLAAHLQSGVVNAQTTPLSLALIAPAVLGLWIGFKVQDRLDQALFRKITLIVLLIAGLNLLRRALFG